MKKYIEFCDTEIDGYVSAVSALKLRALSYEIVEELEGFKERINSGCAGG